MPESALTEGANRDRSPGRMVIWRFSDSKAGHDNQSLGLAEAFAGAAECEIHSLTPMGPLKASICLTSGRAPIYDCYPDPDLILGAGHATHLSMLAARRSRGGRVVVLMTPSLPKGFFDLCLIPEHDRPEKAANVIATRGALNRVRPFADKDRSAGLILLGGPSAHFAFDQQKLVTQIKAVLERDPALLWTAATSRRTPPELAAALTALDAANLEIMPVEETSPGWLAEKLGRTETVWVTEDSASMVYEALSAGAAVGVLNMESRKSGRMTEGIERLVGNGLVTRFDQWSSGRALTPPPDRLDEATRCSRIILQKWPELGQRRK